MYYSNATSFYLAVVGIRQVITIEQWSYYVYMTFQSEGNNTAWTFMCTLTYCTRAKGCCNNATNLYFAVVGVRKVVRVEQWSYGVCVTTLVSEGNNIAWKFICTSTYSTRTKGIKVMSQDSAWQLCVLRKVITIKQWPYKVYVSTFVSEGNTIAWRFIWYNKGIGLCQSPPPR